MWKQLPRATVYQRWSMLINSVSCNFWALANQYAQNKCSEFVTAHVSVFPPAIYVTLYLTLYIKVHKSTINLVSMRVLHLSTYLFACVFILLFIYLSVRLSAPNHQGMAVRGECHSRCRAVCHVDLCCWWLSWTHGDLDQVKHHWDLERQISSTFEAAHIRCHHIAQDFQDSSYLFRKFEFGDTKGKEPKSYCWPWFLAFCGPWNHLFILKQFNTKM